MRSARRWSLLLLPAGLVAGHLLRHAALSVAGLAPPSAGGGSGLTAGLACLAVPLALAVLCRAVVAGFRTEASPARFGVLAPLQIACFVAIELVGHATAGLGPWTSLRDATLLLGILSQLGIAWLLCAVIHAANRLAARASAASRSTTGHGARRPIVAPATRIPAFAVAVSSLSRRGPPTVASC